MEKVKDAKKAKRSQLKELLAVLLSVDKTLSEHPDLALLLEADELFNIIFKITYYDDLEHAVCNANLS